MRASGVALLAVVLAAAGMGHARRPRRIVRRLAPRGMVSSSSVGRRSKTEVFYVDDSVVRTGIFSL